MQADAGESASAQQCGHGMPTLMCDRHRVSSESPGGPDEHDENGHHPGRDDPFHSRSGLGADHLRPDPRHLVQHAGGRLFGTVVDDSTPPV